MLNKSNLVGFIATTKPAEARHFYEHVLGLALVEESPYALVFNANGSTLRIQKVQQVCVAGYTALGWEASDIETTVQELSERGVVFQRYEGIPQDEAGIWRTPGGSRVAWFQDVDGNTLSITEHTPK